MIFSVHVSQESQDQVHFLQGIQLGKAEIDRYMDETIMNVRKDMRKGGSYSKRKMSL